MWWVYILELSDQSYYIGITNNIEKRMLVHSSGKGSKYVRSRLPFRIVYKEEVFDRSSATKREIEMKKMKKIDKKKLINSV